MRSRSGYRAGPWRYPPRRRSRFPPTADETPPCAFALCGKARPSPGGRGACILTEGRVRVHDALELVPLEPSAVALADVDANTGLRGLGRDERRTARWAGDPAAGGGKGRDARRATSVRDRERVRIHPGEDRVRERVGDPHAAAARARVGPSHCGRGEAREACGKKDIAACHERYPRRVCDDSARVLVAAA